jgi:formiminoglutamase
MGVLPVLLSIPHGGTLLPPELKGRVCAADHDLHDDVDAYSGRIYDLGSRAAVVVAADVARTFVDLNRTMDDLPPANPDGVVKSSTCTGKFVYFPGQEPDAALIDRLLKRYYVPYFVRLNQEVLRADIRFAFDCHTMLPYGPSAASDAGQARPLICLGNRGGRTSDMDSLYRLGECFRRVFKIGIEDVAFNVPFSGGAITRKYGRRPIPWIQIEINRSLYLAPPWFDRQGLVMDDRRLFELNRLFEAVLTAFFEEAAAGE